MLPAGATVLVREGELVERGRGLAVVARYRLFAEPEVLYGVAAFAARLEAGRARGRRARVARASGRVRVAPIGSSRDGRGARVVEIVPRDAAAPVERHVVGAEAWLVVRDGDYVEAGDALTDAPRDHHDLLAAVGRLALAEHLSDELARSFESARVHVPRGALELVARAMLPPGEPPRLLGLRALVARGRGFVHAAAYGDARAALTHAALSGELDPLESPSARALLARVAPAG